MTGTNTVPAARVRKFSIECIIVPVGVVADPTALKLKEIETIIYIQEIHLQCATVSNPTYNFLHVVPGFFQPFICIIVFHSLFQVILSFHVQLHGQNRGKERGTNKQEVEGKVLS